MGSTGEADRKRRHISSISSPTSAAASKKHPFVPLSEEKKLDTAVLQYQNQKLVQKLEAQKVEINAIQQKYNQVQEKQLSYDGTLAVVNNSWEELVKSLESCSIRTKDLVRCGRVLQDQFVGYGGSSSPQDALMQRVSTTGATQSSFVAEDKQTHDGKTRNILNNMVASIDDLCYLKDQLYVRASKALSNDGSHPQSSSSKLHTEVKNLRLAISDLHLKHRSLAWELQTHRDNDAKNKAELRRIRGELESTVADLEESNRNLAILKAERDATKGTFFPMLSQANKHLSSDKSKDKQKDLHDMESALKELLDQSSCRLLELKRLHEERIDILKQLSNLQNSLKNVNFICSSQAYALVKDQLLKAKADVLQYQAVLEKLQNDKDNLTWREKEVTLKMELVDVFHRSSTVADSRINELRTEIQKHVNEKSAIEKKLEEASREPGRKEIIAEFKVLVSSFPEEMGGMQSQLSNNKEAASDIHSLRADVQSLSSILERKAKEVETFSAKSAEQVAEMKRLHTMVHDLKESDLELKLILDMYRRESMEPGDVAEARNSEYKAWAQVQSLKSSLDEHNLELRVKSAIEAEAVSQQRLAAAEAEIAEMRQCLEASKRERSRLSDVLKSKHEETEAYLSEIETIGQAYDDMQTQNQQLLQQITERDDYNIKLVLEGVQARQMGKALLAEKQSMERALHEANVTVGFYDMKTARIEDQLKMCSDQVQRLAQDRIQNKNTLENTQKRLFEVRKSSQQLRETLDESQSKVDKNRMGLAELQIQLEKERYERKRVEEDVEAVRRKASRIKSHLDGSSVTEKLQQELREYKEILNCSVCLDRRKEVVITKCYHLFCNPCVQRILETRHRKCPVCSASFGTNDVKPVYI